ncbi:PREDICTED: uncharacterized protein LOC109185392 [Ipomoea nil]|uniref:uncharacterized protein LOC109185392 n=1 Tax=Ipomoea nil TaxID=35883 RepID=UPI000901B6C4|nr:PREDICTED: uncharacterized protein LOC109185392 [Ipomoea nil]
MKLSLKVQDSQCSPPPQPPPSQLLSSHQKQPETRPLLLGAKIPITIFNLPFLSGFSTTTHHPSDLSLSLATNFSSGPTLKLAYTATSSSSSTSAPAAPPLTLTLKSGIGVYGSPKNSPLIISANFSFSPHSPHSNPTFSLLLKPQLGSFSLKKATSSNPNPNPKQNAEANSFGFVPLERPMSLKDFSFEDYGKDSIFTGISVMARTEMPVTKTVLMNCRWGVNFPEDLGKRMPHLTLNKIGIERVDEVIKEVKEKKSESSGGEVELLKGMCFWMKRELDTLQGENREMKAKLEEMKMGHLLRTGGSHGRREESVGKKVVSPIVESSSGFEQWRNKKNPGGDVVKKEAKKNVSNGNRDVESELQKAIAAASSSL